MHRATRLKLTSLNAHLVCVLCGGYLVDATTIIECLHSFCRTCIIRYLETSKFCPRCDVQVHKTRPYLNIRSDKTLQDLVYKLVPNLFKEEMKRRRDFYSAHSQPGGSASSSSSSVSSVSAGEERGVVCEDRGVSEARHDKISLCLQHCDRLPRWRDGRVVESDTTQTSDRRYLLCPSAFTVGHLKKFIRLKFDLTPDYKMQLFYSDEGLKDDYTLLDIASLYSWRRVDPLKLYYVVYKGGSRMRKMTTSSDAALHSSASAEGRDASTASVGAVSTVSSVAVSSSNATDKTDVATVRSSAVGPPSTSAAARVSPGVSSGVSPVLSPLAAAERRRKRRHRDSRCGRGRRTGFALAPYKRRRLDEDEEEEDEEEEEEEQEEEEEEEEEAEEEEEGPPPPRDEATDDGSTDDHEEESDDEVDDDDDDEPLSVIKSKIEEAELSKVKDVVRTTDGGAVVTMVTGGEDSSGEGTGGVGAPRGDGTQPGPDAMEVDGVGGTVSPASEPVTAAAAVAVAVAAAESQSVATTTTTTTTTTTAVTAVTVVKMATAATAPVVVRPAGGGGVRPTCGQVVRPAGSVRPAGVVRAAGGPPAGVQLAPRPAGLLLPSSVAPLTLSWPNQSPIILTMPRVPLGLHAPTPGPTTPSGARAARRDAHGKAVSTPRPIRMKGECATRKPAPLQPASRPGGSGVRGPGAGGQRAGTGAAVRMPTVCHAAQAHAKSRGTSHVTTYAAGRAGPVPVGRVVLAAGVSQPCPRTVAGPLTPAPARTPAPAPARTPVQAPTRTPAQAPARTPAHAAVHTPAQTTAQTLAQASAQTPTLTQTLTPTLTQALTSTITPALSAALTFPVPPPDQSPYTGRLSAPPIGDGPRLAPANSRPLSTGSAQARSMWNMSWVDAGSSGVRGPRPPAACRPGSASGGGDKNNAAKKRSPCNMLAAAAAAAAAITSPRVVVGGSGSAATPQRPTEQLNPAKKQRHVLPVCVTNGTAAKDSAQRHAHKNGEHVTSTTVTSPASTTSPTTSPLAAPATPPVAVNGGSPALSPTAAVGATSAMTSSRAAVTAPNPLANGYDAPLELTTPKSRSREKEREREREGGGSSEKTLLRVPSLVRL